MGIRTIAILSCGIFKPPLDALIASGRVTDPVYYMESMLHMDPERLQKAMNAEIHRLLEKYQGVVLVYGDCHAYINEPDLPASVVRVSGNNCCEIMLGKELYRQLRRQGAFFVLDEWAARWQEVFVTHLGFNDKTARIFMGEAHREILYLDFGLEENHLSDVRAMADFFNLPFRVLAISLDDFEAAIHNAREKVFL